MSAETVVHTRVPSILVGILFAVLATIGLLATAMGLYGAAVMARAGAIGTVDLHELTPAIFNHLVNGGLIMAAVGAIGLLRPKPV